MRADALLALGSGERIASITRPIVLDNGQRIAAASAAQGPMMVTVPPDKKAGDTFIFNVPAPAEQPTPAVALAQPVVAMGQVMPQQAMPQQAMGQQVMGQQHMVQPVMVIQQPVHHHPQYFGRYSAVTQCPTCRHTGPTNVVFDPGCGTWLVCGALALVGRRIAASPVVGSRWYAVHSK